MCSLCRASKDVSFGHFDEQIFRAFADYIKVFKYFSDVVKPDFDFKWCKNV